MFEAVKNIAMHLQGGSVIKPPQVVAPTQTAEKTADKSTSGNVLSMDHSKRAEQKAAEEKQALENQQVTEQMLEELEQDIETMHNVGLKFSKHTDTGRTMIKVLNKETGEIIREIPSENVLDLAAKIEEMIGIMFDKEV